MVTLSPIDANFLTLSNNSRCCPVLFRDASLTFRCLAYLGGCDNFGLGLVEQFARGFGKKSLLALLVGFAALNDGHDVLLELLSSFGAVDESF